jgi:flagellar motility protein MotE (MotC chaperone)
VLSALLALLLANGAPDAPTAPHAPSAPVVEMAALPPVHAERSAAESKGERSTETPPPKPGSTTKVSNKAPPSEAPGAPFAKVVPRAPIGTPREPLIELGVPHPTTPAEPGDATPPSLTARALVDELAASAKRRRDDLAALAKERARLEKLQADIASARAALREESARLEAQAKQAEAARAEEAKRAATQAQKPAARPPPKPGEKGPTDAIAKALKGMKSEPAAALVTRLDRPLAVELLRRMRPADAGALLEKMKPDTAAEMVSALAADDRPGANR